MKIIVGYGEISLKSSQVKGKMLNRLEERIHEKLKAADLEGETVKDQGRLFLEIEEDQIPAAVEALITLPGITYVAPCLETGLETDEIWHAVQQAIEGQEPDTFAVDVRRVGDKEQHPYSSKELEEDIGKRIVENKDWSVDLNDPDLTVHIEARYSRAYIYAKKIPGIGGLPIDPETVVVARLRDHVDAYAAFLIQKRGSRVVPVYNDNNPDEADEAVKTLQQQYPPLKLVTTDEDSWEEAVNQTAELFGAKAICIGLTADQLDEFDRDSYNRTVLKPTCGMSEEDVLEKYGEVAAVDY
jgi:thiamine biosynthesis protein ThiI